MEFKPHNKQIAWALFNAPGKELPANLAKTLTNVSRRLGMSGDGFLEVTATWLECAEGRELSYEEVKAIWDAPPTPHSKRVAADEAARRQETVSKQTYSIHKEGWLMSRFDTGLTLKQARERIRELTRNHGAGVVSKSLNQVTVTNGFYDTTYSIQRDRVTTLGFVEPSP